MKLHDLFEFDDWNLTTPDLRVNGDPRVLNKIENLRRTQPDHQYVGSGTTAYVGRRTNPHEMDRVTRVGPKGDAAGYYIQAVHTAGLHNNPYLPRTLSKPKTQDGVQTVEIERLVPFTAPKIIENEELMLSMWEHWFTIPLTSGIKSSLGTREFGRVFAQAVTYRIIPAALHRGDMSAIRDADMREALQFIHALKSKYKFFEDIHTENVMWRMTGTMPQLVFTDPLNGNVGDAE